jgi:hypothetical protein
MRGGNLPLRLAIAWGLIAVGLVVAVGPGAGPGLAPVIVIFAAVVLVSARTARLLARARSGELAREGASWSFWRAALPPLAVGALLGAVVSGLAWAPLPVRASVAIALGSALTLGIAVGLRWGRAGNGYAPRSTTFARWVVVDTALPFAVIAAAASWALVDWRFLATPELSPVASARHLAGTVLVQGLLGGLAGLLKVGRERMSGLVTAPDGPSLPGPTAPTLVLFIAILLVGPRVLPTMSPAELTPWKTALSFVVVFGCALLGAARAAGPLPDRLARAKQRHDRDDA